MEHTVYQFVTWHFTYPCFNCMCVSAMHALSPFTPFPCFPLSLSLYPSIIIRKGRPLVTSRGCQVPSTERRVPRRTAVSMVTWQRCKHRSVISCLLPSHGSVAVCVCHMHFRYQRFKCVCVRVCFHSSIRHNKVDYEKSRQHAMLLLFL